MNCSLMGKKLEIMFYLQIKAITTSEKKLNLMIKELVHLSSRNLYETFDISKYLQQGKNVVSVILGNGWSYRTERDEYVPLSYGLPNFIAQLEIDDSKGNKQQIMSDTSWKYSKGPIVENSIYYGEIYDARLEQPGWNKIGFDDKNWR